VSGETRTCKYCGARFTSPYPPGYPCSMAGWRNDYCSRDHFEAVHGYDIKLRKERGSKVVSISTRANSIASNMPQPWEEVAMREERRESDVETQALRAKAMELMEVAAGVDHRLPGILIAIQNGETQERIARRLRVSQPHVAKLLSRLRQAVAR